MINSHAFTFNTLQENTYLLWDETHQAIIIDPGCYDEYEREALCDFISSKQLLIQSIVNTHCHIDHVLGNDFLKNKYKANLLIPEGELPVLKSVITYAASYGFPLYREAQPDGYLLKDDIIKFGNSQLQILSLPGHSPDHIGLLGASEKILFSGDVLFRQSIGRTDLPGGNIEILLKSIQETLFALPNDIVVHCGHGPTTTIAHEKVHNPFCAIATA